MIKLHLLWLLFLGLPLLAVKTPKVVSLQISPPAAQIDESQKLPVTVTARLDDNSTRDVGDEVAWASTDASVAEVIDSMIVGQSEGEAKLTARYENTAEAMLPVDVYQTVDGRRLPHEVDESLNNATLLGIDANNNGVRDDVERWIHLQMQIYNGYPEIERAIAMQTAKAAQMALADPTNKDDKVHMAITASMDCWTYYEDSKDIPFNASLMKFSRALKDKVFNTKERLRTYFQYDATLAGRVFSPTPTLQTKGQCETDIDNL
jgi:hypothetical protein